MKSTHSVTLSEPTTAFLQVKSRFFLRCRSVFAVGARRRGRLGGLLARQRSSARIALWSRTVVTGFVVLKFFVGCSSLVRKEVNGEISNAPIGLSQRLAIIPGWIWIALVAARLIRGC
jgi:hypothetical protein